MSDKGKNQQFFVELGTLGCVCYSCWCSSFYVCHLHSYLFSSVVDAPMLLLLLLHILVAVNVHANFGCMFNLPPRLAVRHSREKESEHQCSHWANTCIRVVQMTKVLSLALLPKPKTKSGSRRDFKPSFENSNRELIYFQLLFAYLCNYRR